jgi:hypothetical protein
VPDEPAVLLVAPLPLLVAPLPLLVAPPPPDPAAVEPTPNTISSSAHAVRSNMIPVATNLFTGRSYRTIVLAKQGFASRLRGWLRWLPGSALARCIAMAEPASHATGLPDPYRAERSCGSWPDAPAHPGTASERPRHGVPVDDQRTPVHGAVVPPLHLDRVAALVNIRIDLGSIDYADKLAASAVELAGFLEMRFRLFRRRARGAFR